MAVALPRPRTGFDAASPADATGGVVRESRFTFAARDGYPLSATHYERIDRRDAADVVVFNGGGGTAVDRYRHFLRHLASRGLPVLAYDYRGVGRSAPARRRGFDAGIEDWSELDHAAALDVARQRHPAARLASVSHSIGCLVAAAAPNAGLVEQFVFVAPHTGYWGDYRQPWRWPMALLWHVLMPVVARTVGYFPASWFGLGDDFPRSFALQWGSHRVPTRLPQSVLSNDMRAEMAQRASQLVAPALIITAGDDAFTGESGCGRFLYLVPRIRTVRRHYDRSAVRSGRIGHWGYFRRCNGEVQHAIALFLTSHIDLDRSFVSGSIGKDS